MGIYDTSKFFAEEKLFLTRDGRIERLELFDEFEELVAHDTGTGKYGVGGGGGGSEAAVSSGEKLRLLDGGSTEGGEVDGCGKLSLALSLLMRMAAPS
ncbi:hypothetical protein Ddye_001464 [Dipteronia dyeriana]|uniref:Uncharacterized protein n=1 Tax=Dipteronia dyeriana TaxID=168575 RepID=A0AAE0CTE1_9ROSI|nr:hypothetical protein Ddye_001464 [Dipteronia dyeriana]